MSFVQVSRPRDRRGGREAAGRPLQHNPQHRRTRAHTHPFPALGSQNSRSGLCGVNNALLHRALCTVTLQHSLLLKTFPLGFPRRGSLERAQGTA